MPVGARLLPFALMVAVLGLRLEEPLGSRIAIAAAVFALLSGALSTRAVFQEQTIYREFLTGMPHVRLGSRILPVIEGWSDGGVAVAVPHYGMEDLYTIYRGGMNPLVFAYPGLRTGAHFLEFRQPLPTLPRGIKFNREFKPDLAGVPAYWDYVVLRGFTGQRAVLEREMDLCYVSGRLAVFGRRGTCTE